MHTRKGTALPFAQHVSSSCNRCPMTLGRHGSALRVLLPQSYAIQPCGKHGAIHRWEPLRRSLDAQDASEFNPSVWMPYADSKGLNCGNVAQAMASGGAAVPASTGSVLPPRLHRAVF